MKLCESCRYRNNIEYEKPCIVYRDDCEFYEKERGDMTDDLISRQAVQDYIAKYLSQYLYNDVREAVEVIDEYIGELPPVNPQEPKTDVLDKIRDEISKLQTYKCFEDTEKLVALDEVLQIIDKYRESKDADSN